jgi:hypothetical protein
MPGAAGREALAGHWQEPYTGYVTTLVATATGG